MMRKPAALRDYHDAGKPPISLETTTLQAELTTGVKSSPLPAVTRANQSGKQPVLFIHGLWLHAGSWDPWAELFEQAGYIAVKAGWPADPATAEEARANPQSLARMSIGQVAAHMSALSKDLTRKPIVIGHSVGGLLTQIVAGRGLAAASVAIDPAPFRGVLPLPLSSLRAASPVLSNPANVNRAVALSYQQFRYAFANAVSEDEAQRLYETFAMPAPGKPLFQIAFANVNPGTEARVDTRNPGRGPMLLISGERDNTVPPSIVNASFRLQRRNSGTTELATMAGRGHSLTIDSGWREVAQTALDFVRRFAAA